MRLTRRKMLYLLYQCYEYSIYIYITLFYMHIYIQTHILFSLVALHSDCFVNSDVTREKTNGGCRDTSCAGKSVVITQQPLE